MDLISKAISGKLCIQIGTLYQHLARIRRVLSVHNNAQILEKFYQKTESAMHPVYLSQREQGVFKLILEGASNRQIGERLGISVSGVRRHRENILRRNHCTSMLELIAKYRKGSFEESPEDSDFPRKMSNAENGGEIVQKNPQQHIKGADEIAKLFGVSRVSVIKWAKCGAPIFIIGKKYQANYTELWDWLKRKGTRQLHRARRNLMVGMGCEEKRVNS